MQNSKKKKYYLLLNNRYVVPTYSKNVSRTITDWSGITKEKAIVEDKVTWNYIEALVIIDGLENASSLVLREKSNRDFKIDLLGKIKLFMITSENLDKNNICHIYHEENNECEVYCRVYKHIGYYDKQLKYLITVDVCMKKWS